MVILFECYGNFVSGKASYFSLISKKSRGTITLTERVFSFRSLKDQILFEINVSNITDFVIKKQFNLHTIELTIDRPNNYTFYPHKIGKSSKGSSRNLTESLFRELTRAVFKRGYPVLYETKAGFWNGTPSEENWKSIMKEGFLILTENAISFKSVETSLNHTEVITNITEIHRELIDSIPYFIIINSVNEITSYIALKSESFLSKEDEMKTNKLYELINQAKDYKETEQIQKKKKRIDLLHKIQSMLEVSNRIKLDTMKRALNITEKEFFDKIFKWAKKFNFIIDGDEIVVDYNSISRFINNLNNSFQVSDIASVKVKCANCRKLVDYSAKICPYCGKEI